MRIVILALVAGFLFGLQSGCRSVQMEGQTAQAPLETVWSLTEMEAHLRVLNSSEVEGRATGTQGYARAAEYVAAQMASYKLQPAIGSDYRLMYPVPLNYVQSAQLSIIEGDTLRFGPGVDFLADARSDSGVVHVRRLLRISEVRFDAQERLAEGTAVLIPLDRLSDALVAQLQKAGARAVFIEGELASAQAQRPMQGIVMLRVIPATVERIEAELGRLESRRSREDMKALLLVRVTSEHQPVAGTINVLGYLGGKHPTLSEELIILCADLDAMGKMGGVPTVDFKHFGTSVAAMLDVARVQAEASQVLGVPDRTVLFAAWAGGLLDHAGFRAYLHRPVWPLGATRAVIYLGLRPADEATLREQLTRHGITLYAVPPPDPLTNPGVQLVPSSTQRRMAASEDAIEEAEVDVDMSQTFERASLLAGRMAEEANDLLLRVALPASPGGPVLEQELPVPAAEAGEQDF